MSQKADFSSDEWARLKETALYVGLGMIAISGSGPVGKLRELTALSSCLSSRAVPSQFRRNELVMSLLADITVKSPDQANYALRGVAREGLGRLLAELAVARRNVLPRCESASALLTAKCSQTEADGVKRWLHWVARTVAEASGDRWLGMGRKISDDEFAMLTQISHALHIPPVVVAPTPAELDAMLGLLPETSGTSGAGEDLRR